MKRELDELFGSELDSELDSDEDDFFSLDGWSSPYRSKKDVEGWLDDCSPEELIRVEQWLRSQKLKRIVDTKHG